MGSITKMAKFIRFIISNIKSKENTDVLYVFPTQVGSITKMVKFIRFIISNIESK